MKDSDFRIKLDIRRSPEPANGDSAIWARAQVYAVLNDGTNVAVYQNVTFQIEDGGEGQSNARFESSLTKVTNGDSSATTGWTPWQYFTSWRVGAGTMQAYLTEDKGTSDARGFSFVEPPPARKVVLAVKAISRYWSVIPTSSNRGRVVAFATKISDPTTRFMLQPIDANTGRIQHVASGMQGYVSRYGPGLLTGIPFGDKFTINKVNAFDDLVTLQVDGVYIYAAEDSRLRDFALFADGGASGDDPRAHFRIIEMRSQD
jgi:hypothetical protein